MVSVNTDPSFESNTQKHSLINKKQNTTTIDMSTFLNIVNHKLTKSKNKNWKYTKHNTYHHTNQLAHILHRKWIAMWNVANNGMWILFKTTDFSLYYIINPVPHPTNHPPCSLSVPVHSWLVSTALVPHWYQTIQCYTSELDSVAGDRRKHVYFTVWTDWNKIEVESHRE